MILRLDSGANVPHLYVNTLDTAPWVQRQSALRGHVTGKAAEYFALMPPQDIHIGQRILRDVVFATPLKTARNVHFAKEDGLLPTRLFKRRDGQYIYFKRVAGDLGVFRIRVNGGAPEKIADLKDWHDAGWWGAYMGLDPTDAPLLLRDIASADIYAFTLDQK